MAFITPITEHWLEREIDCWSTRRIDLMTHGTMGERSYHRATSCSCVHWVQKNIFTDQKYDYAT